MSLPEFRTADELGADLWPTWDVRRRRRWIYRCVEERGMPALKLGRQLVFDVSAVSEWLDERRICDNPEKREPDLRRAQESRSQQTNGLYQSSPPRI